VILPHTVVLLIFHAWLTNLCASLFKRFALKLSHHNLNAPNAVSNVWMLTRSDADPPPTPQLSVRRPTEVAPFYSPNTGQKETFFIWTGDVEKARQVTLNTTTWQNGPHDPLRIASHPLPSLPLSVPLAHTALRSLLTTHSSPLSAKMADNICSLSYKQRPLYSVPQVCVSSFACHTKLDLTDMKQIHLFNAARSLARKAQQNGSLT